MHKNAKVSINQKSIPTALNTTTNALTPSPYPSPGSPRFLPAPDVLVPLAADPLAVPEPAPAEPSALAKSARTLGHCGATRTCPYVDATQRTTPFVQPKPACTTYSPPPPEESMSERENFSNICVCKAEIEF